MNEKVKSAGNDSTAIKKDLSSRILFIVDNPESIEQRAKKVHETIEGLEEAQRMSQNTLYKPFDI